MSIPAARRTDPQSSHDAADRLNRSGRRPSQAEQILERLQRGPATNRELAAISLKYTGRVSDLRKLGHDIECDQDGESGLTVYRLKRPETSGDRQPLSLFPEEASAMRARSMCAFCATPFVPRNDWQKFCSYRCRQIAHGRIRP